MRYRSVLSLALASGNGQMFSAGLDLKFMQSNTMAGNTAALVNYVVRFDDLCARLFRFPRPVVAAIEGHAIAGGTCIACCCDFRISNGKGNFGMNEVMNGLSVPFNMMEIVRHAVPKKTAWAMFLKGSSTYPASTCSYDS